MATVAGPVSPKPTWVPGANGPVSVLGGTATTRPEGVPVKRSVPGGRDKGAAVAASEWSASPAPTAVPATAPAAAAPATGAITAAEPPSSPTSTSITRAVTLSLPPFALARSTSAAAAAWASVVDANTSAMASSPTSLVSPSLQSSSRSPVRTWTSHRSTSTPVAIPRARVRM